MNLFENSYNTIKIFSSIYQRTARSLIKTLSFAAHGNILTHELEARGSTRLRFKLNWSYESK